MKREPRRQREMNRGGEHMQKKGKWKTKGTTCGSIREDINWPAGHAASTSATAPAYKKKASLMKAVYRAAKSMPQEGRKYADVITRMVEKSTPKTKKALQERLIASPSSKKLRLHEHLLCQPKKQTNMDSLKKKSKRGSENKEDAGVFSWAENQKQVPCATQHKTWYRVQVAETHPRSFLSFRIGRLKKGERCNFRWPPADDPQLLQTHRCIKIETLNKAVGLQITGWRAEIDAAQDFFQFC